MGYFLLCRPLGRHKWGQCHFRPWATIWLLVSRTATATFPCQKLGNLFQSFSAMEKPRRTWTRPRPSLGGWPATWVMMWSARRACESMQRSTSTAKVLDISSRWLDLDRHIIHFIHFFLLPRPTKIKRWPSNKYNKSLFKAGFTAIFSSFQSKWPVYVFFSRDTSTLSKDLVQDLQFSDSQWLRRNPDARCVADRNATEKAVEKAISWGCSQLGGHSCSETWLKFFQVGNIWKKYEKTMLTNKLFATRNAGEELSLLRR